MKAKEIWQIWKDTRYNPNGALWEVSDQGRIKKNSVPYECKSYIGYKVFGPGWSVHRAVAKLFVPNPNNYNEVDHINGNPLDNRACNLQWCTHKENMNNPITRKRNSEAQNKEETKRRQSESKKGEKNPNYGKPLSETHRKNISESLKDRPLPEETRKKISEALKDKPKSDKWKQNHSEAIKNTHRVYHDDGTWHMEKNIIIN